MERLGLVNSQQHWAYVVSLLAHLVAQVVIRWEGHSMGALNWWGRGFWSRMNLDDFGW